jgi:serine/threonine protein kinase/Flp pilus assembly protein TadD
MPELSRIESIFLAARERQSTLERIAYLDGVCEGDTELRTRVEVLLAAEPELGRFLEPLVSTIDFASSNTSDDAAEVAGRFIAGKYKLLERLAEGGMGEVWVAEQLDPVKRRVAIKLIKPGMDSRAVLARFEAERQALALMDHPSIAKVLDAGAVGVCDEPEKSATGKPPRVAYASGSSRPYFVMELVKGTPITQFCDERKLTTRERLELFVPVCQAIQHAHQKGIIHRDIKPSNILVALHDEKAVPKVIDFGVAKAIGQQLTEKTLYTAFGTLVGTPTYMAPEQATFNQLDVDTRSDIYSLGVVLYELLAGSTPFEAERLKKAALDEVLRLVREEEPPRPSTRLSTSAAKATIAAVRQSEPARLTKVLRGELDWVVMKALEKDRSRRYETANGLAMDIQRYLRGEAVLAVPPSAIYRLRKFTRRNKTGLAIVGMLLLLVVSVGAGVGVLRDRAARDAETVRAVMSQLDAAVQDRNRKSWSEARVAAERAGLLLGEGDDHADLRDRLRSLLNDINMVDRLERVRLDQSILKEEYWDHSSADPAYEATFREYGIDLMTLDEQRAAARIRDSVIWEELVAALDDWVWLIPRVAVARRERIRAVARMADPDEWRNRFREPATRGNRAALMDLAARPEVATLPPTSSVLLARALVSAGAGSTAAKVLAEAQRRSPADFWLNQQLAVVLRWRIRPPRYLEAAGYCRAAIAIRPNEAGIHAQLGSCLLAPEHVNEAIPAYQRAIELRPNYARPLHDLGQAMVMKGDWDQAISYYRRYLDKNPVPDDAAFAHYNLATAYRSTLARDKAMAEYRSALACAPKYAGARRELAFLLANCTDHRLRDLPQALAEADRAVQDAKDDAMCWLVLGAARYRTDDWKGAITALDKAAALQKGAERQSSGSVYIWLFLAMSCHRDGQPERARTNYVRAAEWMEQQHKWMEKTPIAKDELPRLRDEAVALLGINGALTSPPTPAPGN